MSTKATVSRGLSQGDEGSRGSMGDTVTMSGESSKETEVTKPKTETDVFVHGGVTNLMQRFEVNVSLISNSLKVG